jgi:two-component system, chemotaxis family, CheB/CheR fusion protein
MVRVSNHNLIKDPPFSRVDMVVCRNLLIYLNADLQQRLMPVFHYALRPGGWLFLGSAENIGGRNDLFEPMEQGSRIYRRRGTQRQSVSMPLFVEPFQGAMQGSHSRVNGAPERADTASRKVLERYAPPHVVVGVDNDVIRSSSRTGKYLELAEGSPSTKVTDLARRGLRSAVRGVLETSRRTRKRAVQRDVRVDTGDDDFLMVDVVADPLDDIETLLVFQDATALRREADNDDNVQIGDYSEEDRIGHLEDELDETRVKLRTTVEELETSNEELKSSNEEMMSMNEELQSTNEELATVNEELKNKVDQLGRANSDLHNFIEGTQVPTIFLDNRMRIRSFTPATKALFRFQDQDRGRLLSDVVSRVDQQLIDTLAKKVLETDAPLEQELSIDGGQENYMLRVLPYRDGQKAIDGILLVFSDVTNIRQTQADLARNILVARQRSDEIETLYKTAPVGMALIDRNMRFLKINKHFADQTGRPAEHHIGRTLREIAPSLAERMERPIGEVFDQERAVTSIEASVNVTGGAPQDFLIDFYPYQEDGRAVAVGIIIKDVTELRRLERELRRLMDELQHRVKNTLATVVSIVNQTVATKDDRVELVNTLKKRIGALAATHALLTQRDWHDVSLKDILAMEFGPFEHLGRVAVSGPDVRLPPKHALTLTLTLHELATNAAKYGALATADGRLNVSWSVNEDSKGKYLTLRWTETNVPQADGAGIKGGFGTRLIKNAVVHDLQGDVDHALTPDGLQCVIRVALP